MLFQTLDNKGTCVGYYTEKKLIYDRVPPEASKTWSYSPSLRDHEVEYARIYCGGQSLSDVCPEDLKPTWERIDKRSAAFMKAFKAARLDLKELCLYEVLPEFFLYEFCDIKTEISKHIFANFTRPKNYNFLVNLTKMISDIKLEPLNIDLNPIKSKLASIAGKNFFQKIQNIQHVCNYNPYGTVTGRLTTEPGTFPILTLNKDFRGCLKPQNDWFIELDYNAAEIRTLLALSGLPQPKEDIHEWNRKHVYAREGTREEAKKRIFAWLYNPNSEDESSGQTYDKELVKNKYWDGQNIVTEFDREIKGVDNHHALNYIIQSTTSDLVLTKAIEIHDRLRHLESKIAFTMHDSIIIDLKNSERKIIMDLIKIFSDTCFGKYRINISGGKNFGEMRGMSF